MSANHDVRRPNPSPSEWEANRNRIVELYIHERRPLKDVKAALEQEPGFYASIHAYKSMFFKWGLRKNIGSNTMARALKDVEEQSPFELEQRGSDREIIVDGREVSLSQVKRFRRRTTPKRVYQVEDRTRSASTSTGGTGLQRENAALESTILSSSMESSLSVASDEQVLWARTAASAQIPPRRRKLPPLRERQIHDEVWTGSRDRQELEELDLSLHIDSNTWPDIADIVPSYSNFACLFEPLDHISMDPDIGSLQLSHGCEESSNDVEAIKHHVQQEHPDIQLPLSLLSYNTEPSVTDMLPELSLNDLEWEPLSEMDALQDIDAENWLIDYPTHIPGLSRAPVRSSLSMSLSLPTPEIAPGIIGDISERSDTPQSSTESSSAAFHVHKSIGWKSSVDYKTVVGKQLGGGQQTNKHHGSGGDDLLG